jgi:acetyltransferase-like isoleucine patch superfamily enzyme
MISFGEAFTCGVACRLEVYMINKVKPNMSFGKNVGIGDYVHIGCIENVSIGDNVLMASKIFISDHSHGIYNGNNATSPLTPPSARMLYSAPVILENDVWIGESVVILKGVTIGKGSIIGASSLVTHSIPPFSLAYGTPAVVRKKYCFNKNKWIAVTKI